MAEAETPSPLLRCVHKCLNPSSSPLELGGSVGSAGPKLRRSSKEHAGDGWLSPEQSALRQEQHETSILNLLGARTEDVPETDAESGPEEPVHTLITSSPESGDDAARRVHIAWFLHIRIWLGSLHIRYSPTRAPILPIRPSQSVEAQAELSTASVARRSGGKRAAAHKAEALASPRHVPDDELTGKAGLDSPPDDPELVVALQMAKQAAQAQLRPHRVRRSCGLAAATEALG